MIRRSILVCATREAGHFLPMLSVANALTRRGHLVSVYGAKSSEPLAVAAGAEFVENPNFCELDIVSRMRRANVASRRWVERAPPRFERFVERRSRELNFRREVLTLSEAYARHLADYLARHPVDLVLADTFMFGAAFGAELAGVPFATQAVDPSFSLNARGTLAMPPSRHLGMVPPALWRRVVDLAFPLRALRKRLGLREQNFTAELYATMASPELHLVPAYEGFLREPSAPGHVLVGPMSFAPPNGSVVRTTDTVQLDKTTILVTGSTAGHPQAVLTMRRVIDALAKTSLKVVVSVGPITGIERVGPNMTIVDGFAPHDEMIPLVGVLVTHGGWGAVGRALRVGTPMLVTPAFGPQPMIAERLVELGVARRLALADITPEVVEEACRGLVTDAGLRRRLDAIRDRLEGVNSPEVAVDAIEAYLAAKRPARGDSAARLR